MYILLWSNLTDQCQLSLVSPLLKLWDEQDPSEGLEDTVEVLSSFVGAVSQRRALNVGEEGTLQVAGSVGLILPHPPDICLLQPQLLHHGRHLTLFVKEHLSVVTA